MAKGENGEIAALQQKVAELLTDVQFLAEKHANETAELRQNAAELLARIQYLAEKQGLMAERIDTLNQFVLRGAGASSVEHVLTKGFETLAAQLEPLRDMTTKRESLKTPALKVLGDIRTKLNRPDWSDGREFAGEELNALSPDESIPSCQVIPSYQGLSPEDLLLQAIQSNQG